MLLLDVGNTRLKWARAVDGTLADLGQGDYRRRATVAWLAEAWAHLEPASRVVACSVAGGDIEDAIARFAGERWDVEVEWIAARRHGWGVTCGYPDPPSFGPDRWASLVAVRQSWPGAACVFDCGTTITADLLAHDGAHQGGLIMPGVTLMRRSLFDHTARLEETGIEQETRIARNTRDAVATGTFLAATSFIERMLHDSVERLGEPVAGIVTGGDAELIRGRLDVELTHRPALVLEGVAVIARDDP